MRSRVRRILGLALTLLVAFLVVILVVGCRRAGWTVWVVSSVSSDVIVRVEYDGTSRDSFLAANDCGDAAQLSKAPARATALGGYVADGHYFLNDHNHFNEVSRATWEWSLAHTIATLASWPALVALTALLSWRRVPWLWTGSRRRLSSAGRRTAAVEASGHAYFAATPGIEVAGSPLPAGTKLEFHPDGLVVHVGPANEAALARSDVSEIEERRGETAPRIVVHHAVPGIGSPIEIEAAPDSEVWDAVLRSVAPRRSD